VLCSISQSFFCSPLEHDPQSSSAHLHNTDTVPQKWSPEKLWNYFAISCSLLQIGLLVFASYLIHKPFLFSTNVAPFRISVALYNSLMTAAASLVSTLTLVTWANLGAGYLANHLCQCKITYRTYDCGLHWAMGKIHWQTSWSFVISLILFTSTTLHAAAFTAVFGLHPMIEQYPMNGAATNISMNAQLLLDNVMAGYDIAGNDFDVNLAMLVLQWGNHTAGQISELTVDEVTILASAGMVLSAEVAATTVPRLADYSTNVDPKISKILQTNYGLSNLEFESAGVQGTTTCTPIIQSMNWTAQTILDMYTIYNFSSPTCGQCTSANLQKTFWSLYQLVPACTSWYKPEKLGKLQE
jgi:hypothetical protein